MIWEELKERQKQERVTQLELCHKRREDLYYKQADALQYLEFVSPKGFEIMHGIFEQQRQSWYQNEKDEWDALFHAQAVEREEFKKEEVARYRLNRLLTASPEQRRDR